MDVDLSETMDKVLGFFATCSSLGGDEATVFTVDVDVDEVAVSSTIVQPLIFCCSSIRSCIFLYSESEMRGRPGVSTISTLRAIDK